MKIRLTNSPDENFQAGMLAGVVIGTIAMFGFTKLVCNRIDDDAKTIRDTRSSLTQRLYDVADYNKDGKLDFDETYIIFRELGITDRKLSIDALRNEEIEKYFSKHK